MTSKRTSNEVSFIAASAKYAASFRSGTCRKTTSSPASKATATEPSARTHGPSFAFVGQDAGPALNEEDSRDKSHVEPHAAAVSGGHLKHRAEAACEEGILKRRAAGQQVAEGSAAARPRACIDLSLDEDMEARASTPSDRDTPEVENSAEARGPDPAEDPLVQLREELAMVTQERDKQRKTLSKWEKVKADVAQRAVVTKRREAQLAAGEADLQRRLAEVAAADAAQHEWHARAATWHAAEVVSRAELLAREAHMDAWEAAACEWALKASV